MKKKEVKVGDIVTLENGTKAKVTRVYWLSGCLAYDSEAIETDEPVTEDPEEPEETEDKE